MYRTFKMLKEMLTFRERRQAVLLFFLMLGVAFFETLGVASILPFIAVLSNPDVVTTNPVLAALYDYSGAETTNDFLKMIGFGVFVILIVSLVYKALVQWAQVRFSQLRIHNMGCRLMARYLSQPYQFFLNRHSSQVSTTILAEIERVVSGSLFPAMRMTTSALIVLFLVAFLIVLDPFLALSMAAVVGLSYVFIYVFVRHRLSQIGHLRLQANRARYRVVNETFGGIKDVKISGLESKMVHRYRGPSRTMVEQHVRAALISMIPSFALQGLIFGGMILVLLYLMAVHGELGGALPVFATFAFAGYRLMPAVQSVYGNLSQLRATDAALQSLLDDLRQLAPHEVLLTDDSATGRAARMPIEREIRLVDVHFAYPGSKQPALNGLTLTVPVRHTIGLVGTTGCGKTTTVDVILGLLAPQQGQLLVDGVPINEHNVRPWQRTVGYVPQQIYLSDETVARNIAFGLEDKDIDMAAVEAAARVANLHEFVSRELPDGYQTLIGERGVRLSGGQRQRIGIARALYHDPDVLLLDEATSALDNVTETAVMNAVNNLGHQKTIIIIAHRLSTVRACDRIYLLEHGRIAGAGTFDDLCVKNRAFQAMASNER